MRIILLKVTFCNTVKLDKITSIRNKCVLICLRLYLQYYFDTALVGFGDSYNDVVVFYPEK